MKKFGMAKSILFSLLILAFFFTSLEVIQRVRYSLRFHSTYWLLYGFVKLPDDYADMMYRGIEGKKTGAKNIEIIETPIIGCDGYKKNNPSYKTDEVTINSYGFRGKEFKLKKDEGVFRIVALGASTTFCTGTDKETYPACLERILISKTGQRYEVINGGVGATAIESIRNLFEKEVIRLSPDLIIINSLFNNLYLSNLATVGTFNFFQKMNRYLLIKSLFYMTLREKLTVLLHKPVGNLYRVSADQMVRNFLDDDLFWKNMENFYRDIINAASSNEIKVIIVKQPVFLSNYAHRKTWILLDEKLRPVYEKAFKMFDKLAAEREDVQTVGAHFKFEARADRESLFSDGLHLMPKGDRFLADIVSKKILEMQK